MVRIGLALSLLLLLLSSRLAAQERPLQDAIAAGFKAGDLAGLHSVLVMQKGEILAENHFEGSDWSWARSLGVRQHGPKTLHDIRSVTKSIIGLLYGIALAEGKVPGLGKSLIAQFPEYADLARDQKRRAIRVEHTLSMKMGTEWNEELPYSDPRNSEIAMERAKDRYRFALERKMVSEPGSQWVYNGGAVALLAALIQRGTGLPIDKYAEAKLFKPLGISRYEWIRGRDGVPSA
ncbi:MAG: serine hydrolase, partial [Pseudomonadota bacterium]